MVKKIFLTKNKEDGSKMVEGSSVQWNKEMKTWSYGVIIYDKKGKRVE